MKKVSLSHVEFSKAVATQWNVFVVPMLLPGYSTLATSADLIIIVQFISQTQFISY